MFIAKALKTFLHNMGYRMGRFSYFLSINKFSDRTPEEIKKMYSGVKLGEEFEFKKKNIESGDNKEKEDVEKDDDELDLDKLKQELASIVAERKPGYEIVAKELGIKIEDERNRLNSNNGNKNRKMRSSGAKRNNKQPVVNRKRELNIDHGDDTEINDFMSRENMIAPKESSKLVRRVPSTNDQYRPIELVSQASRGSDEEKSLSEEERNKWSAQNILGTKNVRDKLFKMFMYLGSDDSDEDDDIDDDVEIEIHERKDESNSDEKVLVDWRDSGCLSVTRDQGDCGACYAFAATAMMEFLHCQQTGQLVLFSEQYMVDCGKIHVKNMEGCDGALIPTIPLFLMEWGVELRSNYPFLAKETTCPHEKEDQPHAGYMRPSMEDFSVYFNPKELEQILNEKGPMIAVVAVPEDFDSYGGKIHQGHNCLDEEGYHEMLLVGHAKENDQEYWIYRNSYGFDWGSEGYFKLSKKAKSNCFGPHMVTEFKF